MWEGMGGASLNREAAYLGAEVAIVVLVEDGLGELAVVLVGSSKHLIQVDGCSSHTCEQARVRLL